MPDTQPPEPRSSWVGSVRPYHVLATMAIAGMVVISVWPQGHAAFCSPMYRPAPLLAVP